jgi:hypothetical protein
MLFCGFALGVHVIFAKVQLIDNEPFFGNAPLRIARKWRVSLAFAQHANGGFCEAGLRLAPRSEALPTLKNTYLFQLLKDLCLTMSAWRGTQSCDDNHAQDCQQPTWHLIN